MESEGEPIHTLSTNLSNLFVELVTHGAIITGIPNRRWRRSKRHDRGEVQVGVAIVDRANW